MICGISYIIPDLGAHPPTCVICEQYDRGGLKGSKGGGGGDDDGGEEEEGGEGPKPAAKNMKPGVPDEESYFDSGGVTGACPGSDL